MSDTQHLTISRQSLRISSQLTEANVVASHQGQFLSYRQAQDTLAKIQQVNLDELLKQLLQRNAQAQIAYQGLSGRQQQLIWQQVCDTLQHDPDAYTHAQQIFLLQSLVGMALHDVCFTPFQNTLTDKLLHPILKNAGAHLFRLDLSHCHRLTVKTLRRIAEYNHNLQHLKLNHHPTLEKIAPHTRKWRQAAEPTLAFPNLLSLDISHSPKLHTLDIDAPQLESLFTQGCVRLTTPTQTRSQSLAHRHLIIKTIDTHPRIRIPLIGYENSGKLLFAKRLQYGDRFLMDKTYSISMEQSIKRIKVGGRTLILELWDVATQERYSSLVRPMFEHNMRLPYFIFVLNVLDNDHVQQLHEGISLIAKFDFILNPKIVFAISCAHLFSEENDGVGKVKKVTQEIFRLEQDSNFTDFQTLGVVPFSAETGKHVNDVVRPFIDDIEQALGIKKEQATRLVLPFAGLLAAPPEHATAADATHLIEEPTPTSSGPRRWIP